MVIEYLIMMPLICWKSAWQPYSRSGNFKMKRKRPARFLSQTEKWIYDLGDDLILNVEYWKKFYQKFNVKIHYNAEEAVLQNVAQNIALDIIGGVHIGKQ